MALVTAERVVRPVYDKDHPFPARLIQSARLTDPDSAKDTRHVEFDLAGSGLTYRPGDSLGIYPANCRDTALAVMAALGATGEEPVPSTVDPAVTVPLREALHEQRTITLASARLVERLAAVATSPAEAVELRGLLSAGIPEGLHVLDLLDSYPSSRPDPAAFVAALGQLRPRLYSIASSPAAHGPDRVHLTVAAVRFVNTAGRACHGVASTYATDRLRPGDVARVYVHSSPKFGLPPDPTADLVMVGAGTGVAPFRGFLYERRATAAPGRNWLFFGSQHRATDFLYADELLTFLRDGTLAQLDLAFSRDQPHKVYVQHRLLERGADVWAWLNGGTHFRVCGDARMGKDVEVALKEVVAHHGRMDALAADAFVKQMLRDGRYQRDVY